jgi:hypothetical protein
MSIRYKCYFNDIPKHFKTELLEIYQSPFCLFEYYSSFYEGFNLNCFSIYNDVELIHLIIFSINQKEKVVNILNRLIYLDFQYLDLFSEFIFNSKIKIDKIHLHHLANPILKKQVNNCICKPNGEDYLINLPKSVEEYFSSFSFNQRSHTKRSISKIVGSFENYSLQIFEKNNIPERIINRIIEMNQLRMNEKNIISGYDKQYTDCIIKFVRDCGFVSVLEINNAIVAGVILYLIKDKFFLETVSHDPEFNQYSVGHTCLYLTIQKCIERNGKEFHLLWGDSRYKKSFLAERIQLYSITVHRTKILMKYNRFVHELLPLISAKNFLKLLKHRTKIILGQKASGIIKRMFNRENIVTHNHKII